MRAQHAVVEIRRAGAGDAQGIARTHIRSWQGAYRDILPDSFLNSLDVVARAERWRETLQPSTEGRITFLAELHAEIIGFVSCGPERDGLVVDGVAYDGEIYALYLAPEHQRRGIGRRLVAKAAQSLLERGTRSIVIWALKDNKPARAFYELLGGVLLGEKNITIGGAYDLLDVAYGWPDAQTLAYAVQGANE